MIEPPFAHVLREFEIAPDTEYAELSVPVTGRGHLGAHVIVFPCALRHEVTLRRHGILRGAESFKDPVSAAHRFALHCAREDAIRIGD